MSQTKPASLRALEHHDAFLERHIGPNDAEIAHMLRAVGHDSLDGLTDAIVPASIKSAAPLALPAPITEVEALVAEQGRLLAELLTSMEASGTDAGPNIGSFLKEITPLLQSLSELLLQIDGNGVDLFAALPTS